MSLVFPRPRTSVSPLSRRTQPAGVVNAGPQDPTEKLSPIELVLLSNPAISKRVFERLLAALLLAICSPLLAALALTIRCTSRGPAIYAQTRLGLRNRSFTLYKLRTMQHDCERLTGPCWAIPNDPRVTRVGRFLRATHLDELPQLWNVVRGEMSLIGPRPERPEIIKKLEVAIPRYAERRRVLPGLTGLAQLQLPPDTDFTCVRRKLVYDLHYIEKASFGLNCRILLGTVCKVVGLRCYVIPPISMVANFSDTEFKTPAFLSEYERQTLPTLRLATVPLEKR